MHLWTLCVLLSQAVAVPAAGVKSLKPSGQWGGNDGAWSTFELQVGSPPQSIHVLPASSISALLAVMPDGCTPSTDPSNCSARRGGLFNYEDSTSWIQKAIFQLPIPSEMAYGYAGNGSLGFDRVSLPSHDEAAIEMSNATISAYATKDFFIGLLGLSPLDLVTGEGSWMSSLLKSMKETGDIGSLSWGYTAGFFHNQSLGSLTLGGYDPTRISGNELTVPQQNDPFRDLVVALQGITSDTQNLLMDSISIFIDSTLGQIWLPEEACLRFEEVFGLVWDSAANLYAINDTLHADLLREDPVITMTFGANTSSTEVLNIDMPYSMFDQVADWPLSSGTPTRFFPLRRTSDPALYALGRPFFQAAYLTVDYERRSFRLAQAASLGNSSTPQPIAIAPLNATNTDGLSTKYIIAIALGIAVFLIVLAALAFAWFRKRAISKSVADTADMAAAQPPLTQEEVVKAELQATSIYTNVLPYQSSSSAKAELPSPDLKHVLSPSTTVTELPSPDTSSASDGGLSKYGSYRRYPQHTSELQGDSSHGSQVSRLEPRESLTSGTGSGSGVSTLPVSVELDAGTPMGRMTGVSRAVVYELPGDGVDMGPGAGGRVMRS